MIVQVPALRVTDPFTNGRGGCYPRCRVGGVRRGMRETARRIVMAQPGSKQSARAGQPADDGLTDRLLNEPLRIPSGRVATLTAERLRGDDRLLIQHARPRHEGRPEPGRAVATSAWLSVAAGGTAGMAILPQRNTGTVTSRSTE